VSLRDELASARTALGAGSVRVEIDPPAFDLDADVDSLLGWVVREGTTNVLRHARARSCRITVRSDQRRATVEVVDDGHGGTAVDGRGLRGLCERVEGVGGKLTATPTVSGFRLAAAVPIPHPEGDTRE
jgi:two-component system sensor histidine kinase DesK